MLVTDGPLPLISVILAVRNDGQLLGECLRALAAQQYPPERLELIVADGDSDGGAASLVERFATLAPFPVVHMRNERRTAAAGFNRGLRVARGDVIVILGARARPAPSFLHASAIALRQSHADAVGGVVRGRAVGLQAGAVALALGSPFGVGGARYRYSSVTREVDTVNYGAYRREVFCRLGGFDELMTDVEDDEFNYRLRSANGRLLLSAQIRCDYRVRDSLRALARQYLRYGYPKARVLRRHPAQMQSRQFVPALFVLTLGCGLAAAPTMRAGRSLLALCGGAYAIANLLASLRAARRGGWRYLPLLPAAFAGMHVAYGVASLVGAVRFLLLPRLLGLPDRSCIPALPCANCADTTAAST